MRSVTSNIIENKKSLATRRKQTFLLGALPVLLVTTMTWSAQAHAVPSGGVSVSDDVWPCYNTYGQFIGGCSKDLSYQDSESGGRTALLYHDYYEMCRNSDSLDLYLQPSSSEQLETNVTLNSINYIDSSTLINNKDLNSAAHTPTACLRYSPSDGNYYIAVFPQAINTPVATTPIRPQLIPDQPIEVLCSGDETYQQCYEAAMASYNVATCNEGEPGSCGTFNINAEQSLAAIATNQSSQLDPSVITSVPTEVGSEAMVVLPSGSAEIPSNDAVDVFDFIIVDTMDDDALGTEVAQVDLSVLGDNAAVAQDIIWQLLDHGNTDDYLPEPVVIGAGEFDPSTNTISFGDYYANPLSILVSDSKQRRFSVSAMKNSASASFLYDVSLTLSMNSISDLATNPALSMMDSAQEEATITRTMLIAASVYPNINGVLVSTNKPTFNSPISATAVNLTDISGNAILGGSEAAAWTKSQTGSCGSDIVANTSAYTPIAADIGHYLCITITPVSDLGVPGIPQSTVIGPVLPQSQSVIATASPGRIEYGASSMITDAVAGGTLSYSASGGCTVDDNGTVTSITSSTGFVGVCTVTVTKVAVTDASSGNIIYTEASDTVSISVGISDQEITFTAPADQSLSLGSSVEIPELSSSSGLDVNVRSNSPNVCTVSATTITVVANGSCSLTATQSGNKNYAQASAVVRTVNFTSTSAETGATATGGSGGGSFSLNWLFGLGLLSLIARRRLMKAAVAQGGV